VGFVKLIKLLEPAPVLRAQSMPCRGDGPIRAATASRLVPELLRPLAIARPLTMRFGAPLLALLAAALATPAAANGGSGGNGAGGSGTGGAGGSDSAMGPGGAGANGSPSNGGGGGGGAGAVTGGAGGLGSLGVGVGGTGGVHGSVGATVPGAGSIASDGDAGQAGGSTGGGGGGGGGYGAVVAGAGTTATITGTITGGNGGDGGDSVTGQGGSGGSGGSGLVFTNGTLPTTLVVNGTVQGGDGGAAGAGGAGAGVDGTGGFGIVGANLHITNNGTISGGLFGGGGSFMSAILFTGGDNSLTFVNATSGLNGEITVAGGTLTFVQPTDVTVANVISNSGAVIKTGAGTLTLTGANTYTGGTTIAGGKLSVSSDANLGAVAGGLTLSGGTLQVTNSVTLARAVTLSGTGGGIEVDAGRAVLLTGAITGAGGLIKTGAGSLALQNNSSYSGDTLVQQGRLIASSSTAFSANSNFTVAAGAVLEVTDIPGIAPAVGSLAGAGSVEIGTGATLKAGSNNASTTFSGAISGSGALDKTGTGTLTLTGANIYGGGTTVSGGKLVVNGSIVGSVTLAGGALGGSGTVGDVNVASGGTVAPGNSIGTLNVAGNISFAAGSTYQVEINAAGQSDRIVATGLATISGGTVQVLAGAGNYAASTSYTILTASGGVTGRFSDVTSNLVFLTPSLAYGSNNVTLTMTRTATTFVDVALTRNQGFVANAAERLGAGNAVYDTLLSATTAEARAGFDLLSGEAHAQAVSVMIDESRLVRETILSRLRGPLLTAQAGQVAASFSADLPGRKGAVLMNAPVPQPRYALWGEAFGSAGNTDADGNAASLSRRSGGALLGADMLLYDNPGSSLKLGVAGGYSQSRFDLDARRSSGKLDSGHAGLYAGARFGNWRLDAGVAYSWSESDIRRQVQIRGFGDALRLQRPGAVAQGFAELGYGFAFSGFALEPFAQLALIRVSTDAGAERGGAAALRILSSDLTLGFTTLGLRAEAQIGAMPLFARAMLGWRHGFGELTPTAKTAFATGTTPAQVFAARIDRDALTAEAGLDWRISQATALGLTYSAAIGERSRDHALKGRVEMRF
jgi:fibronectin-binding autotransporter adhesin